MNCIDLMSKTSNNAKLQKWSNYDEVHGFDVKTNKNVELRPKPFQTQQTTKVIKLQWIASIWCQNDKKCWVTSQTIPNTAKLQKWSNYDEVHGFDVKTNKNVELVANHSKQRKLQRLSKYNDLHRFDVKTIKNVELRSKPFDTAKLQKWSNYDELHRFDVKTIKNV